MIIAKMIDCTIKENAGRSECKKAVGEAEFKIILPKKDNSGRKIDTVRYQKYLNKVNSIFGGSTTFPVTLGCWVDEKRHKMQCEEGFAITAIRDFDTPYNQDLAKLDSKKRREMLASDYRKMKHIAKEAAIEFGQDSVPVVFDSINDAGFIKGEWKERIEDEKISDNLFDKNI